MTTNCESRPPAWRARVAALLAGLVLAGPAAQAQQSSLGVMKNFSVPDYFEPPHQTQLRWLLKGSEAVPQSGGRILVRQITLEKFQETGRREILVEAPDCLFDSVQRQASSASPLKLQLHDGKFTLAGEGFFWHQTNATLVISNRVRTGLRGDWLAAGDSPTGLAALGDTEITAGRFSYDGKTGKAVYREGVRVAGTNLSLASTVLEFTLPAAGGAVERLAAEGGVAIDYGELHVTGSSATYAPTQHLMRVTGGTVWRAAQREGTGDELVLDSLTQALRVTGAAGLKLPLGTSAFLPQRSAPPDAPAATANRLVEITAGQYEIRTNTARFTGNVQATERAADQLTGRLTCGNLLIALGSSNEVQTLTAEDRVVLEQEDRRLTARHASYDGRSGLVELTGQPAWQVGPRAGHGDVLRANLQRDELSVRGGAYMKLPRAASASLADSPVSRSPGQAASATNTFTEVFSDEYDAQPTGVTFRGRVRLDDPQMHLTCDTLDVTLPPAGRDIESITARQNVVLSLVETNGQILRATCGRAHYTAANDLLELTGQPALETPAGTLVAGAVIFDRAKGVFRAVAPYRAVFRSPPGSETNAPPWLLNP